MLSCWTVAGKNKDVARWLAECETELSKSREKENKMYQAMFQSKLSDWGPPCFHVYKNHLRSFLQSPVITFRQVRIKECLEQTLLKSVTFLRIYKLLLSFTQSSRHVAWFRWGLYRDIKSPEEIHIFQDITAVDPTTVIVSYSMRSSADYAEFALSTGVTIGGSPWLQWNSNVLLKSPRYRRAGPEIFPSHRSSVPQQPGLPRVGTVYWPGQSVSQSHPAFSTSIGRVQPYAIKNQR